MKFNKAKLVQSLNTIIGYDLLSEDQQERFKNLSAAYAKRNNKSSVWLSDLSELIKFYNTSTPEDKLKVYNFTVIDGKFSGFAPPKELLNQYSSLIDSINKLISRSKTQRYSMFNM